jgi:hypothetical protein
LKISKNRENGSELENQELKYDQKLEASGLYRVVFKEGRVIVYVKKEKIAQVLKLPIDKISILSDKDLVEKWKEIKEK